MGLMPERPVFSDLTWQAHQVSKGAYNHHLKSPGKVDPG